MSSHPQDQENAYLTQMVAVPKNLLASLEDDRRNMYNICENHGSLSAGSLLANTTAMWELANTKWKEL